MNKKQLIMEKALELFAKQGFETTSIQQITDYCGISKGAFYLSFKSKDELILALIDHFMQELTTDIDYLVNGRDLPVTLYRFFYTTFETFIKHADFVKLLMKEHTQSLDDELLEKLRYYDRKTDQTILSIIEKVYGDVITTIKYDLVYTVKGLINSYSSFLFFNKIDFDVALISKSLEEKTDILAKHMTTPFITDESLEMFQEIPKEKMQKDVLLQQINSTMEKIEDSLTKDSLILLKEQIGELTYNSAIIHGLIGNLAEQPECKRLSYLLTKYFDFAK
ncbi:TetR/AcrR family transcriptional regulator [Ornithinibacillus bavariensis]|uniref:HTH-type transcriptional regulator YerO n=1 Tax=Ornithinibacillus bavariensis TaxID=545502 RepID=A0A920C689_9BACI|nr:TetR/AcrR family transcriptional regulator [Ornithinibacillus bavariensis]GIO25884.1 putative HTH-type transcriptional regulator YerO [Ornithinibacillus bavariensis]HAM79713.1 TetR family transcriptional regulator [Ornithinibacillus sp.]